MNKTEAALIINQYAANRAAAHEHDMDWMPSPAERATLREAVALQPRRLTRWGRELYDEYAEAAHLASMWEEKR